MWAAAKEAARSAALNDGRLRNASRRVLDFLINKINRQHGFDWHGINAIAAGCIDCQTGRALDRGTVVNAIKELSIFGYILRRIEPVRGGRPGRNKRGETTLPILVRYFAEGRDPRSKIAGRMVAEKSKDGGRQMLEHGGLITPRISSQSKPDNKSSPGNSNCAQLGDDLPEADTKLGNGDRLIPFDDMMDVSPGDPPMPVNCMTEAVARGGHPRRGGGTVGALLEIGRAEAAKATLPPHLTEAWRVPFTPRTIGRIRMMHVDPQALVEKYFEKTRGRNIKNPNVYLMRMAQETVAERDGISVEIVARLARADCRQRAELLASADANESLDELRARLAQPRPSAEQAWQQRRRANSSRKPQRASRADR